MSDSDGPSQEVRTQRPVDASELSGLLRDGNHEIRFVGGGTKPGLRPALETSSHGGEPRRGPALLVEMSELSGVVEYQPSEFTVRVRAGEPVALLEQMLAEHGQYLPFDPVRVDAGATVGGTVASGISGPGRLRFGGVRDFVLGVELIDGSGRQIRGGSRVVKNAAGFDLPKLLVGSAGRFGAIVEVTLKVFPAPPRYATVLASWSGRSESLAQLVGSLAGSTLDLASVEATRRGADDAWELAVRIPGDERSLDQRMDRLLGELGETDGTRSLRALQDQEDVAFWREARELSWADDAPAGDRESLWRLPIVPSRIPGIEEIAGDRGTRSYSCGGQVLWWSGEPPSELLRMRPQLVLPGRTVSHPSPLSRDDDVLMQRVVSVLDARRRLGS